MDAVRLWLMEKFKTIYFIYDADGGLWNELKYWYKKNIKKERSPCELCDISHSKYFVRLEWLTFIRKLKKDYRVRVLHRDEVPQKIKDMNLTYPLVIGKTFENEFKQIMDKISFIDWGKPTNVKELREYFFEIIGE